MISAIFFVVPFVFIFLIASKGVAEANAAGVLLAAELRQLFDNLAQAFAARDYLMVIAFINSLILTVCSVAALVILSAMVAYVWQRRASRLRPRHQHPGPGRPDRAARHRADHLGPAGLGLFKTMPGLILVEIAFGLPFCILLFRAFIVDGATGARRSRSRRRGRAHTDLLPGHLPRYCARSS